MLLLLLSGFQHSLLSSTSPCRLHKALLGVQRAEAEAAKVYEEFVDSFADAPEEKSFVRGGTIQPGSLPMRTLLFKKITCRLCMISSAA